ncbi:hypothetical protein [Bradyrhizobium archetypum]|uniref:Uncharacterized protein n=1 Tax=Bradyrhizobium archetypum TaxID=2721160 RepID=A0A7Y4LZY6_9BRAD|nr:hypothetical protein [Bradyrhizobium archetypum]NOJ44819.1 hypothetical protein [Bradyrhizobium archetypum]
MAPTKKDALGASKKRAAFIGVPIRNDATVAGRSLLEDRSPCRLSIPTAALWPLSNLVGQTVKLHFLVARAPPAIWRSAPGGRRGYQS